MLPPWPLTATRCSKPWWTSESQTSRKTWKNVVVDRRIAARELHVVPGQRHVQRRGDEQDRDALLSPSSAAGHSSERAMKQSVSSGMCGPCCSVVPIGISTASTPCADRARRPRATSSARGSAPPSRDLPECQTPCNTRRSFEPGGADGGSHRRQRRQSLVPDHGRGRARRPDPRRRLRALQLRPGDARARRALQGRRLRHARATAAPTGRCSTTTWRSGPTTRRPAWTRSGSSGRTSTARRWAG